MQLSAFPTGWSVNNTGDQRSSVCYSTTDYRNSQKKIAASNDEVSYQGDSDGVPRFNEDVYVYSSVSQADTAYSYIVNKYNGCKTFRTRASGQTITGTVGAANLGSYGSQSSGFQVQFTVSGVSGGNDIVILTEGKVLALLTWGDFDPDVSTAQHYFREAVQKL